MFFWTLLIVLMHPFYKCININYLKNIIFWTLVYIKFIFNIEEVYSSMYELWTTKIIMKIQKNKEMNAVSLTQLWMTLMGHGLLVSLIGMCPLTEKMSLLLVVLCQLLHVLCILEHRTKELLNDMPRNMHFVANAVNYRNCHLALVNSTCPQGRT